MFLLDTGARRQRPEVILPDVNVLVYAFRREAPLHDVYARWLTDVLGGAEMALTDTVLTGVLRITTNPRIFAQPAPTTLALSFLERLLAGPRTRLIGDVPAAWMTLRALVDGDPQIRGNRIPDAHLAAVAMTHNATVATRDRGFGRYPGLRFFDPADG